MGFSVIVILTTRAVFVIFVVLLSSELNNVFVVCKVLERFSIIELDYVTCVSGQKLETQHPQLALHRAVNPTFKKSVAVVETEFLWFLFVKEDVLSYCTVRVFCLAQ